MGTNAKRAKTGGRREDMFIYDDPENQITLITDPSHVLFQKRALEEPCEAIVLGIMARGVPSPVHVRLNGNKPDGTPNVELVAGRRRYKALVEANRRLRKAGKPTWPLRAFRVRGDNKDAFDVMVVENSNREDVDPLERADLVKRGLDLGREKEEIATSMGVSVAMLENYLLLGECSSEFKRAVQTGQVAAGLARKFSRIPREDQPAALKAMIEAGATKGAKAAAAVKAAEKGKSIHRAAAQGGVRMRSRVYVQRLREEIKPVSGMQWAVALLDFVLGDSSALDSFDSLKAAADRATGA